MSESGPSGRTGEFSVLAEALRAFRADLLSDDPSDRALAKAAGVSPTTIGDWLRGRRFPQDIGKVLIVVRMVRAAAAARGVANPGSGPAGLLEDDRWRAAHHEEARRRVGLMADEVQRAQASSVLAGSAAKVRVGEADPRRLGVHAAISVPGVPDEVPPEYVPRDADAAGHGVRAKVAAAAARGGFVLLVGGSSVGKTRCAAEAVKALLPYWWLVHPAGPVEAAALAATPSQRMVVWLDELQRYLDGEHGLTGGLVRALLNAPDPVVIIGTLWPDRYTAYTAVPAPGGADPHAREREVLDLAAVIRIPAEFSPAEQARARAAAGRDRRLAIALESAEYGLTQTLAAAPQLVARWEDARAADPYAWAVLTAALDAARLGARSPVSPDLLRAAAPGYCTPQQQAEAPPNWFEQALAYATAKLHGAAAALAPAGTGMGHIAGYTIADYLIQHAAEERGFTRVPASTWDVLLSHIRDPADAVRLASSAKSRLLYCYAVPLYQYAADAGDGFAAGQLAELLAERGDLDELRARADAGDGCAAWLLAALPAERGDLDELRARADAGDGFAAGQLARLLAERGDLDQAQQILRARADVGEREAAGQLAALLAGRGDLDQAQQILRNHADASERETVRRLAALLAGREALLAERGDLDELRAWAGPGDGCADWLLAVLLAERGDLDGLRARADFRGDGFAAGLLAVLLAERGDLDQAQQILRNHADAGDWHAARLLAEVLAQRGDLDQAQQILRNRADAGERDTARRLAVLLAERGDLDGLRARADAGDWHAARRLAVLLAERGDLDGLRARADAGDFEAEHLARLLAERGDLDESVDLDGLRARADAIGDTYAAVLLAQLRAERRDLHQAEQILRNQVNAGDRFAARLLAEVLAQRGDLDQAQQILRSHADAGDRFAARLLAEVLAQRGDLDQAQQILRAQVNADDRRAAGRLVVLLAERGDLDGLRAWADAGDWDAAERLAVLLADRGDLDGLRARADAGDRPAAEELARLLADRGDLDELRARADAGDRPAAWQLAVLLAERGDLDELRARADAGDQFDAAARQLAVLLAVRGDLDGLRARAGFGDRLDAAADLLAELLAERGDLDELRARADAGDWHAARRLEDLLEERGDLDQAQQILRNHVNAGNPNAALGLAELLTQDEAERMRRFGLAPDGSIAQE